METFIKRQKDLLEFLNYYGGKDVLGIKDTDPIIRVDPFSYHILRNVYKDRLEIQAVYYTGNNIEVKLHPFISNLILGKDWYANHRYNSFAVDTGSARLILSGQLNWATCHGAANATSTSNDQSWSLTSDPTPSASRIDRSFFPFKTQTIGAGGVVSAATVDLYRDDSFNPFANPDSQSIIINTTGQNDTTNLVVGDWSRLSYVNNGSLALASTTNSTTHHITVTNLTVIKTTVETPLGALISGDYNNSAPAGVDSIGASGAHPPTLTVTYSSGGSFLNLFV
jgi:hypothetical protein